MSKQPDPQASLFDVNEHDKWKEEWKNMPEFKNEDLTSWKTIIVHFENEKDLKEFAALIKQKLTYKTRSIWFPEAEIGRMDKIYISQKDEEIPEEELNQTEDDTEPDA